MLDEEEALRGGGTISQETVEADSGLSTYTYILENFPQFLKPMRALASAAVVVA